jgi:hypothetical protein
MATIDAYALQHSDLNGFLFADVGMEASGMTLSVLSILARVGADPWQEAGRLAKLPPMDAADGLARIIAAMPASPWSLPDAMAIATRLVSLLPTRGGAPSIVPSTRPADTTSIAARLRALLPGRAGQSTRLAPAIFWTTRQWAVVLVLLVAVLAGLTLNLTGQRGASSDSDAVARGSASYPSSPASPSSDHVPSSE